MKIMQKNADTISITCIYVIYWASYYLHVYNYTYMHTYVLVLDNRHNPKISTNIIIIIISLNLSRAVVVQQELWNLCPVLVSMWGVWLWWQWGRLVECLSECSRSWQHCVLEHRSQAQSNWWSQLYVCVCVWGDVRMCGVCGWVGVYVWGCMCG